MDLRLGATDMSCHHLYDLQYVAKEFRIRKGRKMTHAEYKLIRDKMPVWIMPNDWHLATSGGRRITLTDFTDGAARRDGRFESIAPDDFMAVRRVHREAITSWLESGQLDGVMEADEVRSIVEVGYKWIATHPDFPEP